MVGKYSKSPIPDVRLALMFTCAHPAIDEAVRAPLILQTILGLIQDPDGRRAMGRENLDLLAAVVH